MIRCGHNYKAVVAAFDVRMIFVAWDQHVCVPVAVIAIRATGVVAHPDDLSAIIDPIDNCQLQVRTRRNQRIQVNARFTVLP